MILVSSYFISYSQPQELFRTWELVSMEFDMGGIIYMDDIDPPINPYLTIEEDLSYYGYVACNDYSGVFVIESNGEYRPTEVETSGNTCEYQIHIDIEYMYFDVYFSENQTLSVWPYIDNQTHEQMLGIGIAPGWYFRYKTATNSSVTDYNINLFSIYPNPSSDKIFITAKHSLPKSATIYSMDGKKVLNLSLQNNSIDVSGLPKGIYFVEINSPEGSSTQKFIKN